MLDMAFCIGGYFILICVVLVFCRRGLSGKLFTKGVPKSSFACVERLSKKSVAIIVFLVFVAAWIPYFLLLYPGVVTADSVYQINQGLGLQALNNHQPFLHSLLEGWLVGVGAHMFGSIYVGTCFATGVQLVFLAAVFALCVSVQVGPFPRLFTAAFLALNPLIAWYSVTLWKDVVFSAFLLLLGVALLRIGFARGSRGGALALLAVASIGVLLLKKSGIYILVIALAIAAIFYVRNRRSILVVLGSVLVLNAVLNGVLMPMLGIAQGRESEAYSIPLQQMARTVVAHDSELTQADKDALGSVLPYQDLPALYYPKCADNVKSNLDEERLSKDRLSFAKLYLSLGWRFPGTYADAFLCATTGYWYPETRYWMVATSDYFDTLTVSNELGWNVYDGDFGAYVSIGHPAARERALAVLSDLRYIPGLACLFSIGFWVWVYVFLFYVSWKRRLRVLYPLFGLIGAIWLTCMISPVYAEMRYAYSLLLLLPFAFSALVGAWRDAGDRPLSESVHLKESNDE